MITIILVEKVSLNDSVISDATMKNASCNKNFNYSSYKHTDEELKAKCNLNGNQIVTLTRLKEYIDCISEHSASCGSSIQFIGDVSRHALACN